MKGMALHSYYPAFRLLSLVIYKRFVRRSSFFVGLRKRAAAARSKQMAPNDLSHVATSRLSVHDNMQIRLL